MTQFVDLYRLSEDERIDVIGRTAREAQNPVGFMVEAKPKVKAERYISKLLERFPDLRVLERAKGPTPGVVTITVTRKTSVQ